MAESIRIHACLKLICTSVIRESICGHSATFEAPEAEKAIDNARKDGWTFRNKQARCPVCGRAGMSFGKAGS